MANRFDVVVVGGGVVGLAVAWRARRRGLSVLVVERDRVGAGASGVAGGMLAPVTEADFGEERAIALNLAGLERWPDFAADLAERSGVDTGYRRSGALVVAADRDDAESLRRLAGLHRSLGLSARTLSGREARRLEPGLSPRVPAAIEAPQEGHVDPGAVVAGLRAALEAEGGELREGTEVERVSLAPTPRGWRGSSSPTGPPQPQTRSSLPAGRGAPGSVAFPPARRRRFVRSRARSSACALPVESRWRSG